MNPSNKQLEAQEPKKCECEACVYNETHTCPNCGAYCTAKSAFCLPPLKCCTPDKPKDLREEICELVTNYIMDKDGHLTWAQLTELRELINPNQDK